jgi:alpha-glucosidase
MGDFVWWKHGVVYQVYPRSFQDTNGDDVGDLKGISERLDYLAWLGVDAIWISPIYPTPMADFGYDVSDYCNIDPLFGSLDDFDRLVAEAHARKIKIILDFVPNHTSERHPWFLESRASRVNPKRDWYIWRDGKPDGSPPNNWLSQFGGPAWAREARTGQFYLHSFLPEQPDLSWRNPRRARGDVRRAALLARPRCRRFPRRFHLAADQGCRAARQSAEPELQVDQSRHQSLFFAGLQRRPARDAQGHRRDALRSRSL